MVEPKQPRRPRIVVTPDDTMIDVTRRIELHGFPAGEVRLHATLREADGSLWRSQATFLTNGGDLDLDHAAPESGDWREPSSMATVWSMRRTGDAPRVAESILPITSNLHAFGERGTEATATLTQRFLASGVERRDIAECGIVGTLFTPGGGGRGPVVVVLAGSGGGLMERRAALFAAHGYTTLALGYFGVPGLPDYISGTPLEYFETALTWVRQSLAPAGGFVALSGVSRGGELALLLGATFPDLVSAVIAYVPSPFTHGVLNAGRKGEDRHAPAWRYRGRPLPVLSQANRTANWDLFEQSPPPRRQTPAFETALEDADAVSRSLIPLHRIAGPVLLISGEDDALWPSTRFAGIAEQHLRAAGHPFAVRHVSYPDAGHTIEYPFRPSTVLARPHAVSGIMLAYGGTAEGNARASEASWREVLRFLARATGANSEERATQ
jgi:dienelactone hydrolase